VQSQALPNHDRRATLLRTQWKVSAWGVRPDREQRCYRVTVTG
jgi:hypothetical protein